MSELTEKQLKYSVETTYKILFGGGFCYGKLRYGLLNSTEKVDFAHEAKEAASRATARAGQVMEKEQLMEEKQREKKRSQEELIKKELEKEIITPEQAELRRNALATILNLEKTNFLRAENIENSTHVRPLFDIVSKKILTVDLRVYALIDGFTEEDIRNDTLAKEQQREYGIWANKTGKKPKKGPKNDEKDKRTRDEICDHYVELIDSKQIPSIRHLTSAEDLDMESFHREIYTQLVQDLPLGYDKKK